MNKIKWSKEKPEFKRECLLLCATKMRQNYEYSVYQIKKIEFDGFWYWGWLTGDGEEYGAIEDLKSDLYCKFELS